MTFSPVHLTAIDLLVEARLSTVPATSPDRPKWEGLRAQVRAELATAKPANDTSQEEALAPAPAPPTPLALGELVFSIDLPLQIEKVRTRPRLLLTRPGEKPKTLTAALLTKLAGGDKKRAKLLRQGWSKLPAGAGDVAFAGGQVSADWSPIIVVVCPTLNVFKSLRTFAKQNARQEIAERIARERLRWPRAAWGGQREQVQRGSTSRLSPVGGARRFVRVTRCSSRRPDDLSPDVIGGKIALDQLVEAGLLGDDSDVWCAREARWEPAKTGEGHVRIEVFELEGEAGVPRTPKPKKRGKNDPSASH